MFEIDYKTFPVEIKNHVYKKIIRSNIISRKVGVELKRNEVLLIDKSGLKMGLIRIQSEFGFKSVKT